MDGGITEMAARNLKRPFTRVLIDQVRLATIRNTTIRSGIVLGKHNSYLADIIGNLVDHLKDPNYYTYVLTYYTYIRILTLQENSIKDKIRIWQQLRNIVQKRAAHSLQKQKYLKNSR